MEEPSFDRVSTGTAGAGDGDELQAATCRACREGDGFSPPARATLGSDYRPVHCHGRYQTVSIMDISTGGLQLQGAFGVTLGDRIEVELLSGHRLTAKVMWSLGSRIGAEFSPALAPDHPGLVALQRSIGGPPNAPAGAR
jgi:hypothetical protein